MRKRRASSLQPVGLTACVLAANLCTFLSAAGQTTGSTEQAAARTEATKRAPSVDGVASIAERGTAATYRLLTIKEERNIVRAASGHSPSDGGVQDCSHVVQQVYAVAGYEYPYASSFDLYRGTPTFVRVKTPRPGDLIAWPGHVGIVLNARQHSFYSLVSTGWEAQNYRGAYWRGRGQPRFYRYIVERSFNAAAAKVARRARSAHEEAEVSKAAVIEPDSGTSSELLAPHAAPQLAQAATKQEVKRGLQTATEEAGHPGPASPSALAPATPVPATVTLPTANARPTSAEVLEGISALTSVAAEKLNNEDPLKVATPVIIFEQLAVERIELKGDHGWAHLKIDSHVSLGSGGPDFKTRQDKVRWELHRSESGWLVAAPPERAYITRDAAVRILAGHLAHLTQCDSAAQHDDVILEKEARLANLLSALLENR